jgi:hypothetical protein
MGFDIRLRVLEARRLLTVGMAGRGCTNLETPQQRIDASWFDAGIGTGMNVDDLGLDFDVVSERLVVSIISESASVCITVIQVQH